MKIKNYFKKDIKNYLMKITLYMTSVILFSLIYNRCEDNEFAGWVDTSLQSLLKEDKYGNKTGSIAEDDLNDVIQAYDELVSQFNVEASEADYFENKFTTEDGFAIGYGGGKNRLWYITLEKYGKSTILFKGHEEIGYALKEGKKVIEDLKKVEK